MKALAIILLLCSAMPMAAAAPPVPQSGPLPAGASFEAAFSPRRDALPLILRTIASAQKQIFVAAYSFASRPIAQALVDAHKRGVKVFVVADKGEMNNGYTALPFMATEGVPVRLNDRYLSMHAKFMVIDNLHVQLGSFDYTSTAADRNAENIVLLRNVAPLAATYIFEWKRLWEESRDLPKGY